MLLETFGLCLSIFFWLYFTGIGIPPCPEEAGILYAAGLTALHPQVRWWMAWPAAGLGVVAADATLYGVGWLWGERLFAFRWVRWIMSAERRQRIEARFHQGGIKIILLARFLPPLRTGVFLIAGAVGFSFVRFLFADLVYAVVGVGALYFGGTWAITLLKTVGHWLAYLAAVAAGAYALHRYYRYLRERERKGLPQPPVSIVEVPVPPPGAGAADGPPDLSSTRVSPS